MACLARRLEELPVAMVVCTRPSNVESQRHVRRLHESQHVAWSTPCSKASIRAEVRSDRNIQESCRRSGGGARGRRDLSGVGDGLRVRAGRPAIVERSARSVTYFDDFILELCGVATTTTPTERVVTKTYPDGPQTVHVNAESTTTPCRNG